MDDLRETQMRTDALFLAGMMAVLAGEMLLVYWIATQIADTLAAALF